MAARKKGQHFASLGKKVPKGYLAYVSGSEVRIVKRKGATKRRAKRRAKR